jgi:mutator protein MutT
MIRVAAAVCIQNGKVLLASRPADKPPAGWEFPGGKLEAGETVQQAAVRELKEELNWNILPLDIIYQLKKNNIMLYFVRVIPADDSLPRPCENQQIKWVALSEDFPENMLENDREFWKFLTLC